ncbi:MAG TPA: nucleoside-diphosphate sugar epimerase/dehydratase [Acidimicrobiales bacterium]|jgi:FlaA1/EpsC-like NDP-sugar epimerase|nr:nucleoside-diphosphate sugar epimerase/dehydratase [Acidimicrobiales bacterium]
MLPEANVGSSSDKALASDPHRTNVAVRASRIRSRLVFTALDAVCVVAGYSVAQVIYFRDKAPGLYWQHLATFLVTALVVTLVANHVFGLYGRMWRHAGVEEARQLILSAAVIVSVLVALYPLGKGAQFERVPLTVIVVGCMFATMGMGVLRFHSRLFAWQRGARRVGMRVAVVGSRDAGAAAIREMLRSPGAGLVPVAVFDDDPRAHGLSMVGVPVVGTIDDIPSAASRYTLQQVLLTIPDPPRETVEKVLVACEKAGLTMKVLPGVSHLVDGGATVAPLRTLREPQIEDLLGRDPIPIDLATVRRSLEGRRVLVTGAGGSIGSEICRQVADLDPAILVLLDHDETHLHDTVATIAGPTEQALVDITDESAVTDVFNRYRPEVVFHAAGHKHVPVLENHPIEAVSTNVFGTLNVVTAATGVGTQRFVQISSDKAVRPSSVMGATKRLAEQIVLAHAPRGASYCTVRFGNVLGSRGSVIPTFSRQIANGGPVTVTDARMTRFFMSVEEAVQLVLESSMLSDGGGEIFMLEMGEPVRILDLAERMIRLSGYRVGVDIPIDIVGARPGEKFKEELRTPDEEVLTTYHPYINQLIPITVPPEGIATSLEQLREAAGQRDAAGVRGLVFAIAATSGSPRYVESNADGDVGLISADPGSATDDGALEPLAAESTADSSAQVPA